MKLFLLFEDEYDNKCLLVSIGKRNELRPGIQMVGKETEDSTGEIFLRRWDRECRRK